MKTICRKTMVILGMCITAGVSGLLSPMVSLAAEEKTAEITSVAGKMGEIPLAAEEKTAETETLPAETEETDFLEQYRKEIQTKKEYQVAAYRTETFENISFSVPVDSARSEKDNRMEFALGDIFSDFRVYVMEVEEDWAGDHEKNGRGKLFEERVRHLFEAGPYIYVRDILPEFTLNGLSAFRVRYRAGTELAWMYDCLAVWNGDSLVCLELGTAGLCAWNYDWMWQNILFSVRPAEKEQEKEISSVLFAGEEGLWGRKTTRALQEIFALPVDGLVKEQYAPFKKKNPGLLSETFEWMDDPKEGSNLIRSLQKMAGAKEDGFLGEETVRALQRFFKTPEDGVVSLPSQLIRAMQKWAEKQLEQKR